MSEIRSERAKSYIAFNSCHKDSKEGKDISIVTPYLEAEKAVIIAESDAHDRAIRAFDDVFEKHFGGEYGVVQRMRETFVELLKQ